MKHAIFRALLALVLFVANEAWCDEAFPLATGTPYRWVFGATIPASGASVPGETTEVRFTVSVSRAATSDAQTLVSIRVSEIALPEKIKASGATLAEMTIQATKIGSQITKITVPEFDTMTSEANRKTYRLIAQEIISKAFVQIAKGIPPANDTYTLSSGIVNAIDEPRLQAQCRVKVYSLKERAGVDESKTRLTITELSGSDTDATIGEIEFASNAVSHSKWRRVVTVPKTGAVLFEHYSEIALLN